MARVARPVPPLLPSAAAAAAAAADALSQECNLEEGPTPNERAATQGSSPQHCRSWGPFQSIAAKSPTPYLFREQISCNLGPFPIVLK